MPSQKSSDRPALDPKRQRGRDRVDAILSAATALIIERGYGQVTMTEIAAKADTAIGSLYRFFPTKGALAGALLNRYGTLFLRAFDQILADASRLSSADLADRLVDLMGRMATDRQVALSLADQAEQGPDLRQALRESILNRMAMLLSVHGGVGGSLNTARAQILIKLLKMIRDEGTPALDSEARRLVCLVLEAERVKP